MANVPNSPTQTSPEVLKANFAQTLAKAEAGDLRAQVSVGIMYLKGRGVMPDVARVRYWFRLAAEAGDEEAAFQYGCMFAAGIGVPACMQEAQTWFLNAARGGHSRAQYRVGLLYELGMPAMSPIAIKFLEAELPTDSAAEPATGQQASMQTLLALVTEASHGPREPFPELAAYWYKRAAPHQQLAAWAYDRLIEAGVTPSTDRFDGAGLPGQPYGRTVAESKAGNVKKGT